MNLDKIVAVSGLPGLYNLTSTRTNGLLITDFDEGVTKFVSTRQHQFTPLATVSIYTNDDSVELQKVFRAIKEKETEIVPVDINKSSAEIRDYFLKILPDHDIEKVHISDIKKVLKWYEFLKKHDLLQFEAETKEEE